MKEIIEIDTDLCSGCGLCILVCSHDALTLINDKARLGYHNNCVGDGNCLEVCSRQAITLIAAQGDNMVGRLALKSLYKNINE